ncbi:MAG: DUF3048 domain-containing protein, partial [Acidimicrobiales bacterium]
RWSLARAGGVVAVIVGVVLVAASQFRADAGGRGAVQVLGRSESATLTPLPTTTTTTLAPVAPLTGITLDSPPQRPALAVKIENSSAVLGYQAGLEVADIVYEEMVEGGITRFVAVFHSTDPATVGPVRSVRPMDPPIVGPLGGLFAYSGGAPAFVAAVQDAPVQSVAQGQLASAYQRVRRPAAPHNLFANAAELWAAADADHSAAPRPLFTYSPPAPTSPGTAVSRAVIAYPSSKAEYAWDPDSGTWLRSQGGKPHVAASGTRLSATNVIIQHVQVSPAPSNRFVPESQVVGEGEAWALVGGTLVHGRWSKASLAAPTVYVDDAGQTIALAPGRTWVQLLPADRPVEIG